jgi:hydroxymethylpyrimidine pyrophosphatase-like HAD family hydrolase
LGSTVKIFCTTYPKRDFALLDIVHPEASKGIGVAATAREVGVAREEVMAVGDNFNDLEMLQFAGTAVVMANAEPALQRLKGFHTTASNDEDGVAISIEEFILAPTRAPGENAFTHPF